ncbi:hypothetical protein ACWIGG_22175 [Micromonospora aurantiaca (nom. illeg.)]
MDVQETVDNFVKALEHCQNLIRIHRAVGGGAQGRRTQETSLNRGVVVLAVATWQAFAQDLANALREEALREVQSVTGAPLLIGAMKQWDTDFKKVLELFSTPGYSQTQQLLGRVGFNPRPSWTWQQRGGRGFGGRPVVIEPHHVEQVMKQWLRIRHDIAHGHATLTPEKVLAAVRDPLSSSKARLAPNLRLSDAIDCMRFFRSVAKATADAAATHVRQPAPTWPSPVPMVLGLNP